MKATKLAEFMAVCRARVAGELRDDRYSRMFYSTDAGLYQIFPHAVLIPRAAEDVIAAMTTAAEFGVPVLARGAGTSLAGQAVNEALVIDFSRHLDQLVAVNAEERWARVQPGVVVDDLNAALRPHGLQFGPDPASADRSTIGGAVANRPHQRFNQTVGFFAQLVLYRRKLHEIKSWQQLWEANRNTIQKVVDRQFFPVVTSLPVPRTDVWIMFQQYQKARWVQDDLEREDLGMRSGGLISSPLGPWEFLFVDPHFNSSPVQLEIVEQKDSLQGILHYRVSCFSKKKARFYVEDFQKRLRASLADPTAPIE